MMLTKEFRLFCCLMMFGCCVYVCTACVAAPYTYRSPQAGSGFPVASVESEGLSVVSLQAMVNATRKGVYKNIHSILLLRNGKLLLEEYFHGYKRDTKHDLRSATKSITSLLIGIGMDRGLLKNEKQNIASMLPRYKKWFEQDQRKKKIQLEHLLSMKTGLACNDQNPSSPGQEDKMYRQSDWLGFLFQAPMVGEPGTVWSYCTGGVVALGRILQNASNMSIPSFAQKHLFGPLDIHDLRWSEAKPKGTTDTGGHLWMRPIDLAKLGQMVINNGRWKGKAIVSSTWLQKSFQWHDKKVGYGYLWWVRNGKDQKTGKTIPFHYARGNGGQFLILLPTFKLIAVFTGGNYNSPLAAQPLQMIGKYVLAPLLSQTNR